MRGGIPKSAAIADYDIVISLDQGDAEVYYNRGFANYRLKRPDDVKEDLQEALDLARKVPDADLIVRIGELLQDIESCNGNSNE